MARKKGHILLDGRIGDMVFYNTRRYGMVAREIGRVPKKVREQGASFEKPRRNNTEFGYGSKVGKLLRLGVKKCFKDAETGDTNTRLAGRIKEVLSGDTNMNTGSGESRMRMQTC